MLTTTSTNRDWARQDLSFLAGLSSDRNFSETETENDVSQFIEKRTLSRELELCLSRRIAVEQSLEASTADVGLIWQRLLLKAVLTAPMHEALDETSVWTKLDRIIQVARSNSDTSIHPSLWNDFPREASGVPRETPHPKSKEVTSAVEPQDLVKILRSANRIDVANQLETLLTDIGEDLCQTEIDFESLRGMVLFHIEVSQFEYPVIGLDPVGNVQAEWSVLDNGLLVMNFQPDGLIRFVAISAPAQPGIVRKKDKGTLTRSEVLQRVHLFLTQD